MGIHGLMKLLNEECPGSIKEQEMENYTGRRVAIDASMVMYQFLIAVRTSGTGGGPQQAMLMNEAGEVTSHIQGIFNRTIKMMSNGIKPVYVFDGKPPQMKGGELAKRMAARAKAESELETAKEAGDTEDIEKFSKRLVKVTRQHNEDAKELLRLMGVPVITAPCEAEAQCAELAKKKKVYATATEDMDALTFRTPKLVRRLTFSQGGGGSKDKQQPILELDLETVLAGLELTYEQFVDLCILCGCDYCSTIKGVGPKTALKLIKQHKNIEGVIAQMRKEKKFDIPPDWLPMRVPKNVVPIAEDREGEEEADADGEKAVDVSIDSAHTSSPEESAIIDRVVDEGGSDLAASKEAVLEISSAKEDIEAEKDGEVVDMVAAEPGAEEVGEFEEVPPLYVQARKLFLECEVHCADNIELKWQEPDVPALSAFLVDRMGFNPDRVASGIKKLKEAQLQKSQQRMDCFFAPVAGNNNLKRKADEVSSKGAKGKPDAKKQSAGGKGAARRK
eukprot:gene36899-48136_t